MRIDWATELITSQGTGRTRLHKGRPMSLLTLQVLKLLLTRPMTLDELAVELDQANRNAISKALERMTGDRSLVKVVGEARQYDCKKPVRLYVATAKAAQELSGAKP